MSQDLIDRLRKRAEIRRQIPTRKSVQNNEPDRIADLLEEAARVLNLYVNNNINDNINRLEIIDETGRVYVNNNINDCKLSYQDNEKTLKVFIKYTKKNISVEDYVDEYLSKLTLVADDYYVKDRFYSREGIIRQIKNSLPKENGYIQLFYILDTIETNNETNNNDFKSIKISIKRCLVPSTLDSPPIF